MYVQMESPEAAAAKTEPNRPASPVEMEKKQLPTVLVDTDITEHDVNKTTSEKQAEQQLMGPGDKETQDEPAPAAHKEAQEQQTAGESPTAALVPMQKDPHHEEVTLSTPGQA